MLPPGTLVPADTEHRRFYASVPANPGQEHAPGSPTGWTFTQDRIAVVPQGEDPPVLLNGGLPWVTPWPRLDVGGENYLAVSAYSYNIAEPEDPPVYVFPDQTLEPSGLTLEAGRVYGGSLRLYIAPASANVSVTLYRHLCAADEALGGLALGSWNFTAQDADPWPVGPWKRIEIPLVLCDAEGLRGISLRFSGPPTMNRRGPLGVDNFVLVDLSPGARRTA